MSRIVDWVADLLFPNRCPCCGAFITWDSFCCDECAASFEKAEFCGKCGQSVCECGKKEIYYDGCAVAAPYKDKMRDGVLNFKYRNGFNFAKYFSNVLAERLEELGYLADADIIAAVPMSKKRRRLTGYNQSEYIAKLLSKRTGLKCEFNILIKREDAAFQHDRTAKEREKAAKLAYSESKRHSDISGKTVILCDDIITTGSTLSECARILKNAGASRVYCAVICGTLPEKAGENTSLKGE